MLPLPAVQKALGTGLQWYGWARPEWGWPMVAAAASLKVLGAAMRNIHEEPGGSYCLQHAGNKTSAVACCLSSIPADCDQNRRAARQVLADVHELVPLLRGVIAGSHSTWEGVLRLVSRMGAVAGSAPQAPKAAAASAVKGALEVGVLAQPTQAAALGFVYIL